MKRSESSEIPSGTFDEEVSVLPEGSRNRFVSFGREGSPRTSSRERLFRRFRSSASVGGMKKRSHGPELFGARGEATCRRDVPGAAGTLGIPLLPRRRRPTTSERAMVARRLS